MSDFNQKLNELNNTADYTAQQDSMDVDKNRLFCILCYIGILVLIPMFAGDKNSRYTRFHTSQGFTLFVCEVCCSIVFGILGLIPGVRIVGIILSSVAGLCWFILMIIGIVNTYNGNAKELPIIGKIHLLKY